MGIAFCDGNSRKEDSPERLIEKLKQIIDSVFSFHLVFKRFMNEIWRPELTPLPPQVTITTREFAVSWWDKARSDSLRDNPSFQLLVNLLCRSIDTTYAAWPWSSFLGFWQYCIWRWPPLLRLAVDVTDGIYFCFTDSFARSDGACKLDGLPCMLRERKECRLK